MYVIWICVSLPVLLLGLETGHTFIIKRIAQRGVDAIAATAARATVRGLQARKFTLTNGVLDATAAVNFAHDLATGSCSLPCMTGPWGCGNYINIAVTYDETTGATVTADTSANCIATFIWRESINVAATLTLPPVELPP